MNCRIILFSVICSFMLSAGELTIPLPRSMRSAQVRNSPKHYGSLLQIPLPRSAQVIKLISDDIEDNGPRSHGLLPNTDFTDSIKETEATWDLLLKQAGISLDLAHDPKFCEEFSRLSQKTKQQPLNHGKYYFLSSQVSRCLRNILDNNPKGVQAKDDDGQVILIRYNLSKEYVLFLVENSINFFELR